MYEAIKIRVESIEVIVEVYTSDVASHSILSRSPYKEVYETTLRTSAEHIRKSLEEIWNSYSFQQSQL